MKFRKKPIVIEAVQWLGNNFEELKEFMDCEWERNDDILIIATLEGNHQANIGDWVIKGIKGEFYPCKPDIFEQTYEADNSSPTS